MDYAIEHPQEFHKGSTSKADMKLLGFRHDRAKLEAIGIKGMISPKNRFLTCDGVDDYFVKEAEARRAFIAKQGVQDPG